MARTDCKKTSFCLYHHISALNISSHERQPPPARPYAFKGQPIQAAPSFTTKLLAIKNYCQIRDKFISRQTGYRAVQPPSTLILVPVIAPAFLSARNSAISAICCSVTNLPVGCFSLIRSRAAASKSSPVTC